MPLYELLCLAKPALAKPEMAGLMKSLGALVFKHGGVITDIKSYGDQHLAYDIKRPFERYEQAHIWQMDFMTPTTALPDLNHDLHVNDRVLRWVIVKRPRYRTPLPVLMAAAAASRSERKAGKQAAPAAAAPKAKATPEPRSPSPNQAPPP